MVSKASQNTWVWPTKVSLQPQQYSGLRLHSRVRHTRGERRRPRQQDAMSALPVGAAAAAGPNLAISPLGVSVNSVPRPTTPRESFSLPISS